MKDRRNIIGITMGDPYGVGPEIIVKALRNKGEEIGNIIITGSLKILQMAKGLFAPEAEFYSINDITEFDPGRDGVPVLDVDNIFAMHENSFTGLNKYGPTPEGGDISIKAIRCAVEMALSGDINAIVTAPISKEAIHLAGYTYDGHTEFLAELTNTKRFAMMLAGGTLKVILATTHCAISEVPELITEARIYMLLKLTENWWKAFLGYSPNLAVAALNPHGGEGGIFGREEEQHIKPAIEKAKGEGIKVSGPYPADTLFHYAKDGRYDAVIVMYHDQGLIPLKMLSFGRGVNCTIGLPIIRTSVDHGTAFDIAWQGRADTSSLIEAIRMARSLIEMKNNPIDTRN